MLNEDYDVSKAFATIEQELTASMMRNLERHKAEELKEGYNWTAWQAEQLRALREYQQRNQDKYTKEFAHINAQIDEIINQARADGALEQELEILENLRKGYKPSKVPDSNVTGQFFKINDAKMNALINATKNDFKKGEVAMLRQADDEYRRIIFNAQMYAASGAGTYEKAVDMATKDFLSKGITSIEYANGSRHSMAEYSRMCLRTASKRAYLTGEGESRQARGIHLVKINLRQGACPLCAKWLGKVLIDDVWSGGSKDDGDYPLMSEAVAAGLYHPNCKDIHSTYFGSAEKEIDDLLSKSKEEKQAILDDMVGRHNAEQKKNYAKRQEEKYGRLADYSLDEENRRGYETKRDEWKDVIENSQKMI